MKRILFLPHSSEPSGAPRVTVDLARRLAARGWDVELALPSGEGIAKTAREYQIPVTILHYPVGSFVTAGLGGKMAMLLRRVIALLRLWIWLLFHRPSVAWVGSSVALPFVLACRMALVRVIVHVHEHPAITSRHPWRIWLLRHLAHGLVFVGPRVAAPFAPRPTRQSWAILANPMEDASPISNAAREELRRSLGAEPGDIVLVCVAFLHPRKDHDTLLRAVALASQTGVRIRLWVVGGEVGGHEGMQTVLEDLAAELGIGDRVQFLGLREDVSSLFQAGDVGVLTSREEAMPLSIAEAQLAGRPVVATDVGDVARMIRDGQDGLLARAGDVRSISDVIVQLAKDGDLRRRFGLAARQHALRNTSAERRLPRFEALINRVLQK
jgi:glycosyltransferase involved in cell wall biosynthesis